MWQLSKKIINFQLSRKFESSVKHEINFFKKYNEILAKPTIKIAIIRLFSYSPNINMGVIFVNTENNRTKKLHKFVLNLLQKLDLRNSSKLVYLLPEEKYKTTIKKNNNLKIIALT